MAGSLLEPDHVAREREELALQQIKLVQRECHKNGGIDQKTGSPKVGKLSPETLLEDRSSHLEEMLLLKKARASLHQSNAPTGNTGLVQVGRSLQGVLTKLMQVVRTSDSFGLYCSPLMYVMLMLRTAPFGSLITVGTLRSLIPVKKILQT
jgi:hypothetical protein